MASVRLTKELQKEIKEAVRTSFNDVLGSYQIDSDTAEAVKEYAVAELYRENRKYQQARAEFDSTLESIRAKYGATNQDNNEYHANAILRSTVDGWSRYAVVAVDPESEDQEEIEIYSNNRVYFELDDTYRRVITGSPLSYSHSRVCRDQSIVDRILPTFLKERSIIQARDVALEYASNMMAACNTLGQLIRKWPDAVNYVPAWALDALNTKTNKPATPKPVETDSIMNIDEAMKSIRLQAEAVKALRG